MRAAPIAVTVRPEDTDGPPLACEAWFVHPGLGLPGHYEVTGHDARELGGSLWPGDDHDPDAVSLYANARRVFFCRASYRPQDALVDWWELTRSPLTVGDCVEVAERVVRSLTREAG